MFTLGRGSGMDTRAIAGSLEQSLPPIAGILLIVAAGGGFKQTLIDTKIADLIASFVTGRRHLGPAGWAGSSPS